MKRFFTWLKHQWRLRHSPPILLWQREAKPCVFCQRPIAVDYGFCQHCGTSQRDTSAIHPIVPPKPSIRIITTQEMQTIALPGERPMRVYRRALHMKEGKYFDETGNR